MDNVLSSSLDISNPPLIIKAGIHAFQGLGDCLNLHVVKAKMLLPCIVQTVRKMDTRKNFYFSLDTAGNVVLY